MSRHKENKIRTHMIAALALGLAVTACDSTTGPETDTLSDDAIEAPQANHVAAATRILSFDFRPLNSNNWNITWRVNQLLRWADVKVYTPQVFLDRNSTGTLYFYVMEDRPWYQNDIILGIVEVNFSNSTTPSSYRYFTRDPTGRTTRNPSGAPNSINTGFWLGCTEAGRVRGNYDKGDNGHAAVYLQRFSLAVGISVSGGPWVSTPRSVFCLPG